MLSKGTYFACRTCRDVFSAPIWHCRCGHHWIKWQDDCKNCGEPRGDALLAEPEHFTTAQLLQRSEEIRGPIRLYNNAAKSQQ